MPKKKDLPSSPARSLPTSPRQKLVAQGARRGLTPKPAGTPSSPRSSTVAHAVMKSAQVTLEAAHKVLTRSGVPDTVLDPLARSIKALKSHLGRKK